jgi:hypothetical protein
MTVEANYAETYNALDGVEDANAQLSERGSLTTFLADFELLAMAHGVTDEFGAFLLHRHFDVNDGQMILERPEVSEDGEHALVAAPRPNQSTDSLPTRWMLTSSEGERNFVPIEFSTDTGAVTGAAQLVDAPSFVDEFATLITDHGLDDLLGLCVVSREHLEPADEESWWVEESTHESSVVVVRPRSDARADDIETVWIPVPVAGCGMKCRTLCKVEPKVGGGTIHVATHAAYHGYAPGT